MSKTPEEIARRYMEDPAITLLRWLAPPTEFPGRNRSYHRLLGLLCAVLGVWALAGLPPVYTALVAFLAAALVLAYLPF